MNITDIDRDIVTIRNLTSRIDAMLMLLEVPPRMVASSLM